MERKINCGGKIMKLIEVNKNLRKARKYLTKARNLISNSLVEDSKLEEAYKNILKAGELVFNSLPIVKELDNNNDVSSKLDHLLSNLTFLDDEVQ